MSFLFVSVICMQIFCSSVADVDVVVSKFVCMLGREIVSLCVGSSPSSNPTLTYPYSCFPGAASVGKSLWVLRVPNGVSLAFDFECEYRHPSSLKT